MSLLTQTVDDLVRELAASVRVCYAGSGSNDDEGGGGSGSSEAATRVAHERFMVAALALDALLGQGLVDKALEICKVRHKYGRQESPGVCAIVAKVSRRRCWHVRGGGGHGGRKYLCVEDFCSCPSFALALEGSAPLCKHLLAVRLAEDMGTAVAREVEDGQYSREIMGA